VDLLGLIFEITLLAMAIYLYLFAIGKISAPDENIRKKSDAFREKNGTWLRVLSLAMIAIMLINLFLHLQHLWMN